MMLSYYSGDSLATGLLVFIDDFDIYRLKA